jgi:hypothetical protein
MGGGPAIHGAVGLATDRIAFRAFTVLAYILGADHGALRIVANPDALGKVGLPTIGSAHRGLADRSAIDIALLAIAAIPDTLRMAMWSVVEERLGPHIQLGIRDLVHHLRVLRKETG